jgi:hypothetical protein
MRQTGAGHMIRPWLVTICAVAIALACSKRPGGAQERQRREVLIARVVIEDLMQLQRDPHQPGEERKAFCVFMGVDAQGDYRDAPPSLLKLIEVGNADVHPASECAMKMGGLVHNASGAKAQMVGIYNVEWKSDDFVKVEGERLVGFLAGGSWIYTLSMTNKDWVIDTVKAHKVI